jgi:hypothetical protein
MYTFVNKNYLVPIIINELNEKCALNKLYQETICRTKEYNELVYVIYDNENIIKIFYSDGIYLYCKNNIKSNDNIIIGKISNIDYLNNTYLVNNLKLTDNNESQSQSQSQNQLNCMNLSIDNKFDKNVILIDSEIKYSGL